MARTKRPEAVTEIQRAIGNRCRWVLDEVNPNQSDLARELEIDQSTINKYLAGSRAQSIFFIRDFAKRFKVSTDYLLRGALVGTEERSLALRLASKHPEVLIEFGEFPTTADSPRPAARKTKNVTQGA